MSAANYMEPGVYLDFVQEALDFIAKETKKYNRRETFRNCEHDWDIDSYEDDIRFYSEGYSDSDWERYDKVMDRGPKCWKCGLYRDKRYTWCGIS